MNSEDLEKILSLGETLGKEFDELRHDMENTRSKIKATKDVLKDLDRILSSRRILDWCELKPEPQR